MKVCKLEQKSLVFTIARPSVCLTVYVCVCFSISLPVCHLSVYPPVCLSVCFSLPLLSFQGSLTMLPQAAALHVPVIVFFQAP